MVRWVVEGWGRDLGACHAWRVSLPPAPPRAQYLPCLLGRSRPGNKAAAVGEPSGTCEPISASVSASSSTMSMASIFSEASVLTPTDAAVPTAAA